MARRHGLPQELAVRAYELEKAYEVNWRQIEGGLRAAGASAAELDASSRQMREEVRSAQEKMLGEEAFKTYRSLSAGGLKSWSR